MSPSIFLLCLFPMLFISCTARTAGESEKSPQTQDRQPISADRFEHLSGKKTPQDRKKLWDQKYSTTQYIYGKKPSQFLVDNYQYYRTKRHFLDLGMGEGRNAVYLAQKGHQVTGLDISSVAISKAKNLAAEKGTKIKTILARANEYPFRAKEFDGIICFYFLDRALIKKMVTWLRPGGLLIFESYTKRQLEVPGFNMRGHKDDYFLKPQELLTLFPSELEVVKFEEPLHEKSFRSSIILRRPFSAPKL